MCGTPYHPLCVTEFHFSALCHGGYVLWAELWFVVCVCALNRGTTST